MNNNAPIDIGESYSNNDYIIYDVGRVELNDSEIESLLYITRSIFDGLISGNTLLNATRKIIQLFLERDIKFESCVKFMQRVDASNQGWLPASIIDDIEDIYLNRLNIPDANLAEILAYSWDGTTLKYDSAKKIEEKLLDVITDDMFKLKQKILEKLNDNKEPSSKILADYINQYLDLYTHLRTYKYYMRTKEGGFKEINDEFIVKFCNEYFGENVISRKTCESVLNFITNPLDKDYNIIEFNNGILNTKTQKFSDDKSKLKGIPKLILPFKWNPKAKPGKIGLIIDRILDNLKYPEDKELWMKAVGHAFNGYNKIGKMIIVQGPSGTGKSTLTTILQRLFNYSSISTQAIVKNERFTLYPMIGKDINIDDDIGNGILKGIGHLNQIVTGNGLEVELKGVNGSIQAENPDIPKLFANGNTLPPVIGEGFERRLLLINASNPIPKEDRDESLQTDILFGEYDDDLEWLVYECINLYWDTVGHAFTSEEKDAQMLREYEFRSYPLLSGIRALFEDSYDDDKDNCFIENSKVKRIIKQWCKWAYENGKISKEHVNPSVKQIKSAMDKAGFNQEVKKVYDYERNRSIAKRGYSNIKTTKFCNTHFVN